MASNHRPSYDVITISLHWLMALLIFGLFGLGLYMVELSYYDAWYQDATALHKNIGVCVFFLLVVRIAWRLNRYVRLKQGKLNQPSNGLSGLEKALALMMHCSLYALITAICISGYMISTAGGRELDVFNLVTLPALAAEIPNQEDLAGEWHFYLSWGMIFLVVGHTLAAFKHHFIDKNSILTAMLWPSKTHKRNR